MKGAPIDRLKLQLDRLIALAGLNTALLIAIVGLLSGRDINSHSPHPEELRSGVSKDAPVRSGEIWSILRDAIPAGMAPQDEGWCFRSEFWRDRSNRLHGQVIAHG